MSRKLVPQQKSACMVDMGASKEQPNLVTLNNLMRLEVHVAVLHCNDMDFVTVLKHPLHFCYMYFMFYNGSLWWLKLGLKKQAYLVHKCIVNDLLSLYWPQIPIVLDS